MATITDIAKECNVSVSTVSRILNYDISLNVQESTRQNVLDVAKKLNYNKKPRKSKKDLNILKVGIVQWYSMEKELNDPFYLSIRIGAEHYLTGKGIELIRFFKGNDDFNFKQLDNLDALICIGKFSRLEIIEFRKVTDKLVFVDLYLDKINVSTVVMDFENAVFDAIDYLNSLNHKKIGYLGGIEKLSDGKIYTSRRKKFFERQCKKYNIEYEPYTKEELFTIESGYQMTLDLIKSNKLPTAFFCGNDSIAYGALRALHENNIKVPEDISLIGFNDNQNSSYTTPSLTTLHAPTNLMGEQAAKIIYGFLNNKKNYPTLTMFPCELVIRKSCTIAKNR